MVILSFRDSAKSKCLIERPRILFDDGVNLLSHAMSIDYNKPAFLLIHGYNTDQKEALDSYRLIQRHWLNSENLWRNTQLIGLLWPSNGNPFIYYGDRSDAIDTGKVLADCFNSGYLAGVNKLILSAHSMGNLVVASFLEHTVRRPWAWVSMGADLSQKRMEKNGKWGRHLGKLQNTSAHIYSPEDRVLGIVAKLAAPVDRLGEKGLPKNRPENAFQINAAEYSDKPVRHRDYKYLGNLITETYNLLLKELL